MENRYLTELRRQLNISPEECDDEKLINVCSNSLLLAGIKLRFAWRDFKNSILDILTQ
jgi:hypothetical protein